MKKLIRNKTALLAILLLFVELLIYYNASSYDHTIHANDAGQKSSYKIVKYGPPLDTTGDVTVVAVYFKLNKSKHNHLEYTKWMVKFLASVSSPIVLFCSDNQDTLQIERAVRRFRKTYSTTLFKIVDGDHWSILNEIGQLRNKSYVNEYKRTQWRLDSQRNLHSPDL